MAAGQEEYMETAKICPVCGKEFTEKNRKYCSHECSNEGYRRRQAKCSKERYHAEKERLKEAGKVKKESPLQEMARKAREAGMTYGQYVALEYGRIENARCKTDQSGQI